MSEPLATATVIVRPDTTKFRTELDAAIKDAISKAGSINIPVGTGAGAAARSVTGANSAVAASLRSVGAAQDELTKKSGVLNAKLLGLGSTSAKLDAALLGLRTAVGSTAVIGLGAGALAAIALGNAFRNLIGATASFETELNTFQATTGATASEMERMSKAAEELGADITLPAVSAADAAGAMTELAKAGLSVQDSIAGARGVLQLATAAAITNAEATQLAASAINAFGLAGSDAVRVADILANAANSAQGSISDMGLALSQAAAVGRQVGLSLEDTSTFLTILAKNGLRGSDAGTSLRTALIRLLNPTDEAAEKIKELGIVLRDAEGNLRVDIFQQFSSALRGVSPAVWDQTLALVGGQDALRAFSILGRQSIKDLLRFRAEMRETGTAAEVAAARTKDLAGSAEALGSALQTAGIKIGQGLSPALQSVADSATAAVNALSGPTASRAISGLTSLLPSLLAGFVALKVVPAIFTSIQIAVLRTRLALLDMASASRQVGKTTAAVTALKNAFIALRGTLISLGIFAAVAGFTYLITRESEAEKATKAFKKAVDDLAGSLSALESAQQGAADAVFGAERAKLGIEQAEIAEATARAALANSTAAKGSAERRQQEIALALAIQDVTFAERDYARAVQKSREARDDELAAQERVKRDRQKEIESTEKLLLARLAEARVRRDSTRVGNLAAEEDARKKLVDQIKQESKELLISEDANERAQGKRLQLLAELIRTTEKVEDVEVDVIFDPKNTLRGLVTRMASTFKEAGFTSAETYERYLLAGLRIAKDRVSAYLRGPYADAVTRAAVEAHRVAGGSAADAFDEALSAGLAASATSQQRSASLQRQLDIAAAGGASLQQQLAIARRQRAEAQRRVDAIEARVREIGSANIGKKQFEELREERQQAAADLRAASQAVVSLEEQIAAEAKSAQSKIAEARDKADQAVLDAIEVVSERSQKLLRAAERTEGLRDDLKIQRLIAAQTRRAIAIVEKTIKDAELKKETLKTLNRVLEDTLAEIADIQKTLVEQRQARIEEAITLDIEFFGIAKNVQGEIRARQRLIALLKKQQDAVKKGSVEYKRLRNRIREEQEAIKELRGQMKERNNAFKELAFSFLQAQQGFAANLLGNLIPGGATSGLVGNTSPSAATSGGAAPFLNASPGRAINPEDDLAARAQVSAGVRLGVSRGQANSQTELLRQILAVLKDLHRGAGFPEARYNRIRSSSAMDTGGGGGVATA